MKVTPIFPAVVDNSMRKALVRCQKLAYWQYECGLRQVGEKTIDKLAGKAFAAGLEDARRSFYEGNLPQGEALASGIQRIHEVMGDCEVPAGSNKSPARMAGALSYYLEQFPFATDPIQPLWIAGKPMIECSFVFDLPIANEHSTALVKYTGRFDMLGLDENGDVWVVDEKTTNKLGDNWPLQWALDSQVTGYVHGARHLLKQHGIDKEVKGAIINGISILKHDYGHVRLNVPREQWEIDRWQSQMLEDFLDWKTAHDMGAHRRQALDHACALYTNPCDYAKLCKARNPERMLEGNYVVKRWNPLTREEE